MIRFSQNILKDIKPRAMTRDIDWGGIPVPGWEDQPTKRLYVWFDAVIGYLSASIEWARRSGGDPEAWRRWWNDPESLTYYFMGKDNIVFHTQIWPAEMLAQNGEGDKGGEPGGAFGDLNLPTEVVSSEFLTMEARSSPPRRASSSTCATCSPATSRMPCATSSAPRDPRTRMRTSPGRSSSRARTTSWSPGGATWSTAPPR